MGNIKYVVTGIFAHTHKDSFGESISSFDYDEAMEIYNQWKDRPKKYKSVFMEKYEEVIYEKL